MGWKCRRGSRCGAGAACVVAVLSAVTENKAFDLPACAERGSGFLWGGTNGAGGRGAFVVCVLATW